MNAKTKTYKTIVPYVPESLDEVRWLTRESFEHTIESDNLLLVSFDEHDVEPDTIPEKTREIALAGLVEEFGINPDDVRWRQFVAVAKLKPETELLLQAL